MRIKGRTVRSMFVATLGIAALSLVSMMPAHADNVTVDFYYGAGAFFAPGGVVRIPIPCPVAVAEGTSASGVLDAAVQQGCIVSWQPTPGGSRVACIDYVCSMDITPCPLAQLPRVKSAWSVTFRWVDPDGTGHSSSSLNGGFRASPGSMIEAFYIFETATCYF